jgi:hypothetical protein
MLAEPSDSVIRHSISLDPSRSYTHETTINLVVGCEIQPNAKSVSSTLWNCGRSGRSPGVWLSEERTDTGCCGRPSRERYQGRTAKESGSWSVLAVPGAARVPVRRDVNTVAVSGRTRQKCALDSAIRSAQAPRWKPTVQNAARLSPCGSTALGGRIEKRTLQFTGPVEPRRSSAFGVCRR